MTPIAAHKFGESGPFNHQVLFLPNKSTTTTTTTTITAIWEKIKSSVIIKELEVSKRDESPAVGKRYITTTTTNLYLRKKIASNTTSI